MICDTDMITNLTRFHRVCQPLNNCY